MPAPIAGKKYKAMLELFIAVLGGLFSLVNPLGAVPVFLALTPHYSRLERQRTAFLTSLYFSLVLLLFFFGGSLILSFFGISLNAMRIAGGLVIVHSGYSLLSGEFAKSRAVNRAVHNEALEKDDISFAPMAMPLLSGPGSISFLIGAYAEHSLWHEHALIALVILFMGGLIYLILNSAPYLYKLLGEAGLKALSRIMGFLVMAIGVQYIISGVVQLVSNMIGQ